MGDLVQDQFTLVPFRDDCVNLAPAGTWVWEDQAMLNEIVANPDGLVPHVAPNSNNSAEVRTRLSACVPFACVQLLLREQLAPKAAFRRLHGAVLADNRVADCRPLLDCLKVAATASDANDPHTSAVVQAWPQMPQPPNEPLLTFFGRRVDQDLPDRKGPQPTAGTFQPAINAIDGLTAEQRQQRLDALARQQATERGKTPTQFFGEHGVLKLMRLAQVCNEAHLPDLWTQLAAAPKTGRLATVQNIIDEHRQALGVHFETPVSASFVTELVQLNFVGAQDKVTQGITPFMFGLTTPDQAEQRTHRANLCRSICSGEGVPSLADTMLLESPDDAMVATTLQATQHSFDGLRVVLAAMWGVHHPVVNTLEAMRRTLEMRASDLAVQAAHRPTLPADLQRHIQVELRHWILTQERAHQPQDFTARNVVDEAAKGNFAWVCTLPADVHPTPPVLPPAVVPARAPTPQGTPSTPGQNLIVRNPQYDARFDAVRDRVGVRSRDVKRRCTEQNIALPMDDSQRPRCLPHHIKGQCNSNCGAKYDHHNNHTSDAQDRLHSWAENNWKTE